MGGMGVVGAMIGNRRSTKKTCPFPTGGCPPWAHGTEFWRSGEDSQREGRAVGIIRDEAVSAFARADSASGVAVDAWRPPPWVP